MDVVLLFARIIHILSGTFWAGAMIFVAAFLVPALGEVGPDAGKVVAALARRRFLEIVPAVAILAILSGLWLFWLDSTLVGSEFMQSRMGMTLSTGGVLAIVAFALGVSIIRPSMKKALSLSQAAMSAEASQKEAMLSEAASLRMRGAKASRWVAVLLVLAATTMAVARYV